MKRILSICLSLLLLASALTACKPQSESQWEFEYKLEKSSFKQGETICITVTVTNNGKDYRYTGSPTDLFGPAKLYPNSDENQALNTLPFANTDDATERVFKRGEKALRSYEFSTDESSPEGLYTLKIPFGGEVAAFESIIFVDAPPTEEELAVIELADTFIVKEYPSLVLDTCRVETSQNTKGEYSVEYTLTIGNYRTWESYHVSFNADKTVKNSYASYEGKYSAYLPYVTDERIREVEEKLTKQVEQYDTHSGFYLQIDDEGYLCLNAEVIVDLPFFDHEHKFFSERICSLP